MTSVIGAAPARPRIAQAEFVAIMALLVATTAFSIDAMLPAMGAIADDLSPAAPNRANLVIPVFALGMGAGTLVVGPVADAFGRRPVVIFGALFFSLAALCAWLAPTLETLLMARFVQGLAAAVPRVTSVAIVRDLYAGRAMARIMSLVMVVFTLVPALAPSMAAGVMERFGWRAIFACFIAFTAFGAAWYLIRLGETLPPAQRRPVRPATLRDGLAELLSHPVIRRTILAQSLVFGMLFAMLGSSQAIFDQVFARGQTFPYWFALSAVLAAFASILNARIVGRLGMRRVVTAALSVQVAVSAVVAALAVVDLVHFPLFMTWMTGLFFMIGLTIGNLNALGMEPFGHIAGLAASLIGGVATIAGAVLAMPVTLLFDGTVTPLLVAVLVQAALAVIALRGLGRGLIRR